MDHKKGYFITLCHRGHSDMLITAPKGEVTWTQFAHTEHDWDNDVEINYYIAIYVLKRFQKMRKGQNLWWYTNL